MEQLEKDLMEVKQDQALSNQRIDRIEKELEHIKQKVVDIFNAWIEARSAKRTLVILLTTAGTIGALISWFAQHFKFVP